jgi:asparagine synthase (glutamine-hydrolysing)
MSGIFGIIHYGGRRAEPAPGAYPETMRHALRHLGPDGSRVLEDKGVVLGHLAAHITPESVHETLPFKSACGRYMITSDTRIDNREELIERLALPHPGRDAWPDGPLILEAFKKWGKACPEYLRGEFAFALWDRREESLFCACDHIGLRSFFYFYGDGIFAFSSQVPGLTALPFVPVQWDERHLARYLRLPVETGAGDTLYKGIKKLRGSRFLELREGRLDTRPYWTPPALKTIRYRRDEDYAEALRELLTRSVRSRLRSLSHIKVGVALSGGLDSSSIACLAARELAKQGRRLTAVAGVLPENRGGIEQDERPYIRAVLEQEPNIDIVYVTPGERGPFDDLETAFAETHRPVPPYHYLHRALWGAARDKGVGLMFYGEGGDHMASYSGTDSLVRLALKGRWFRALDLARAMASVQGAPVGKIIKSRVFALLLPDRLRYRLLASKKGKAEPGKLLYTAAHEGFISRLGLTETDMKRELYRTARYPGFMLEKLMDGRFAVVAENIRMSHFNMGGLFPFLDKQVMEFCLAAPPDQFIIDGQGRSLLRRAMEGILPPPVQWRKDKAPFSPDFHRRVLAAEPAIAGFLDALDADDPVHRYIDIQRIKSRAKDARPAKGRKDWDHQTNNIVARGFIAVKFLKWLENRG